MVVMLQKPLSYLKKWRTLQYILPKLCVSTENNNKLVISLLLTAKQQSNKIKTFYSVLSWYNIGFEEKEVSNVCMASFELRMHLQSKKKSIVLPTEQILQYSEITVILQRCLKMCQQLWRSSFCQRSSFS